MSKNIVSVIVPTKNSSQTLRECLLSIKKQTYKDIELIVVDNFSTDATPEIARQYANLFFSRGPERSAQRNFGVTQAKGRYVAIIDSDMTLSPNVIAECVQAFASQKEAVGVIIPEESFGDGFWAQCKKLERSFYLGIPYMEAARFFEKTMYNKVGGYDSAMVSGEDWDLSQRIENYGRLVRCESFIHHNEGRISLWKTVKKKFYYARRFSSYRQKTESLKVSPQTSILGRYWLFLSHPRKLFANPIIGLGMLFMKTVEFFFGALGMLMPVRK